MSAGSYFDTGVLNLLLGTSFGPAPSIMYISLHSGNPGITGANECAGGGYARIAVQMSTFFGTPTAGVNGQQIANALNINTSVGLSSGYSFSYWGLWDASSNGNFWLPGAALPTPPVSVAAGVYETFTPGQLVISLPANYSTYFANGVLNLIRGTAFGAAPATMYIAFHTAAPGGTGASECAAANGYARTAVAMSTVFGSPASGGGGEEVLNSTQIMSANASGSGYSFSYCSIWDNATIGSGHVWVVGTSPLNNAPITLVAGQNVYWNPDELTLIAA